MANITLQLEIPKPCKIDAPVYDHFPHGWDAPNSVNVKDCVPTYRNIGGGASAERLTDLPTAIRQCIIYLDHRIAEAEKLKRQLKTLLEQNT